MIAESFMFKLKRLGFPIAAIVLFIATSDGFAALLQAKDWDLKRWGLAVLLAAVLDAVLISSILEWLKTRAFTALLAMAVFMTASAAASTNFWYRLIRGSEKTVEIFDVQRDTALQQMIFVRDRIDEAKSGLSGLSAYSGSMALREVAKGDTCGQFAAIPGPRQRFRQADANFFAGLEHDLSAIPPRISAEIDAVRALHPEPGVTLAAALDRLRLALSSVASVLHDPALPQIADLLHKRIAEDQLDRKDGKTTFNCADPAIRAQAANALARIEKLPATTIEVSVPDLTSPSESLHVLKLLADWRTWGEKGGLSFTDGAVLAFAVLLEIALLWSARSSARGLRPERVLEELGPAIEFVPDTALGFIRALIDEPDPRVRWFFRVLARYIAHIGFHDRLVVAHGCQDARTIDLAWVLPTLVAIGWARRDRWLPNILVDAIGWWRWPETRGCERRETFRINRAAFDELHLGEVIARMRTQGQSSAANEHGALVPTLQPAE